MNARDPSASETAPEGEEARTGASAPPAAGYPLLLIRAANYRAGIPVAHVREVLIRRRVARVPDAEFPLLGVLSLRGDMVSVFDLAGLQAAADRGGGTPSASDTTGLTTGAIRPNRVEAVVVLRGGKDSVGLVVDGVEDIRDFRPSSEGPGPEAAGGKTGEGGASAAPPPPPSMVMAPAPGRLWAGIVNDDRGEIGVLDANAAMEVALELCRDERTVSLEVAENGAPGAPAGMMGGRPGGSGPGPAREN